MYVNFFQLFTFIAKYQKEKNDLFFHFRAQALNASISNQTGRANRGKVPPPLLRSRTLPAIIVPGIPVVSLHTDKSPFQWGKCFSFPFIQTHQHKHKNQ